MDSSAADSGVIDVNVHFGTPRGPVRGVDLPTLEADLDRHETAIALVRSLTASRNDPRTGNRGALEAAERSAGRLRAVAEVAPFQGELTRADLEAWRKEGAVAFHLAFGSPEWAHGPIPSAVRSPAVRDVLASIARVGLPLLVPVTAWADAGAIGDATAGLGIPVVLLGVHYSHLADDLAALESHQHLYVETSSLASWGAVERIVSAVGMERLLFGSDAPARSAQSPLNAVRTAAVPEAARRAILRGNAARLFGLPDGDPAVQPSDTLTGVVDGHTHVMPGPWAAGQLGGSELGPALARFGISAAVASSALALMADTDAGNREVIEAARLGGVVSGYLVVDPWDLAAARETLRRWGGAPGIVGAKVHCLTYEIQTRAPEIGRLFDILADFGRPVLIHNDGPEWDAALLAIARRHPNLPIIVAHGGLSRPQVDGARLAATAPNVYIEFASSFAERPVVAESLRVAGAAKVVFGTDAPLLNPAFVLGTYQDAGLDPVANPDVFGGTARRLFGL